MLRERTWGWDEKEGGGGGGVRGVLYAECCCSALQCVAVCGSVLQCVAVCCSVLQYVAVTPEYRLLGRQKKSQKQLRLGSSPTPLSQTLPDTRRMLCCTACVYECVCLCERERVNVSVCACERERVCFKVSPSLFL